MKLFTLFPPILQIPSDAADARPEISALHSGNLGDVIYSLPTAFALGVTHFVLNVCVDPAFGNRAMNSDGARKLAPLLAGLGTIRRVSVIASQVPWEYAEPAKIGIDYVLDTFRSHGNEPSLHLIYRHALAFGVQVRGEAAWLAVEPLREGDLPAGIDPKAKYAVVSLTNRYRRFPDDHYVALLEDVPPERLIFVGVESDLAHKVSIAGAHLKVVDFAHLARVIGGAALMIGNPSFPYAIAEALKVPRLVELPDGINVAPLDCSGLAMHLHSFDSLRTRVFQALEHVPPELATLRDQLRSLTSKADSVVGEKILVDQRLDQAERDRQALREQIAQLQATVDQLRGVLDQRSADEVRLRDAIEQLSAGKASLQEALDWSTADRESLRERIDRESRLLGRPGFHFKGFVRSVMNANRLSRSIYDGLAKTRATRGPTVAAPEGRTASPTGERADHPPSKNLRP